MSWWQHFESEVPQLAELGVTQVWLPPPNKAGSSVCALQYVAPNYSFMFHQKGQGYDAYDLVILAYLYLGQFFLTDYFITVGFG